MGIRRLVGFWTAFAFLTSLAAPLPCSYGEDPIGNGGLTEPAVTDGGRTDAERQVWNLAVRESMLGSMPGSPPETADQPPPEAGEEIEPETGAGEQNEQPPPVETGQNPPQTQAAAPTQNSQAAQAVRNWIRTNYGPIARPRVGNGLKPLINLLNNLPNWIKAGTTTNSQNGNLVITFAAKIGWVTIPLGNITLHRNSRYGVQVIIGPVTITGGIGGTTISWTTPAEE